MSLNRWCYYLEERREKQKRLIIGKDRLNIAKQSLNIVKNRLTIG